MPRRIKDKRLTDVFPNASESCRLLNSAILPPETDLKRTSGRTGTRRGVMNKVESQFALILEVQKRNGEILRYEYEGITLQWSGIRYTPDFVVFIKIWGGGYTPLIKLIEVKGPFIKGKFERAVERFRHARTYWPEFSFEMWQKQKQGWKRKL